MTNGLQWFTLGLAGWMLATSAAAAQTSVSYGKITAVKPVAVENAKAQGAGALVGGTLGLISGRGQSGSNQALRGVAGGVAGQQVAKRASTKQAFEYTMLMAGQSTITVVTDEAGMRVGDCVAVERRFLRQSTFGRRQAMRSRSQADIDRNPRSDCLQRGQGRSPEGNDRRGFRPSRAEAPAALRRLAVDCIALRITADGRHGTKAATRSTNQNAASVPIA